LELLGNDFFFFFTPHEHLVITSSLDISEWE